MKTQQKLSYFFHKFIFFVLLLCFFCKVEAQTYPVRLVPVLLPPYSMRLSELSRTGELKVQVQVLMTDLQEPQHYTGLKFSLESGLNAVPYARSSEYIEGLSPFLLFGGNVLTLTNHDLRPLFEFQNLSGINAVEYAKPLPDGVYRYCFQAYDFYTRRDLSAKTCATVFLTQNSPPRLQLPQNGEKVQSRGLGSGIVFQWMPMQVAPNTRYIFTLKELWDLEQSPTVGFLSSVPLWQEETYAPSLYYGADKTALIAGKRYAWQVQARSGNPVLGGSPTEDNGVYKNNGLSEIFYFDYVENCDVPSLLMAKNSGRGRVELSWSVSGSGSSMYKIDYRKKGSTGDWQSEESYQTRAFLTGLEDSTEYEYRIGSVCGLLSASGNVNSLYNNENQGNAYAYSSVQYFTTDSEEARNRDYQCGVMPDLNISNKTLLSSVLGVNEVFTAGDFPVTVLSSSGSNGTYSGEGYITIPYLADTKVKVVFNNIKLNTDKQLIEGIVETTYDPTERNVVKPFDDITKTLMDIIVKDKFTDADNEVFDEWKNMIDFYTNNIDDIEMSEEDKDLFLSIRSGLFFTSSSLNELTQEQKDAISENLKTADELYEKYKKEFDKLKEDRITYINPNYNNNPITIGNEKYDLEKLIERTNTIKDKLKNIYNSLSAEEKLILDLPMIQWKLGFKTGAVFILKWLEGKGEPVKIPYSFIDNNPIFIRRKLRIYAY